MPAISDPADTQTPGDLEDGDGEEDGNEEEVEGDMNEELAAKLDLVLENEEESILLLHNSKIVIGG